jgi:trehalose-6-phosphatase
MSPEEKIIKKCIRNLDEKDEKLLMKRLDSLIIVSPGTLMRLPLKEWPSGAKSIAVAGVVTVTPYCVGDDDTDENDQWFVEVKFTKSSIVQVYIEDDHYLPIVQATFACMDRFMTTEMENERDNDEDDQPFE